MPQKQDYTGIRHNFTMWNDLQTSFIQRFPRKSILFIRHSSLPPHSPRIRCYTILCI